MTAAEKAKDLVEKFMDTSYIPWSGGKDEASQEDCAKDAALICVDEIISIADNINSVNYSQTKMYWESVKEAINKL